MVTRQRFAAAPIVALGIAFLVVLAMGQFISSSPSTAEPSPSTSSPPTARAPETADSLTFDLGPIVGDAPSPDVEPSDDPGFSDLEVQVWRVDADQVHVCLQQPKGWRIRTDGWTPTGGRVFCRDATTGDALRVTLERA
jgi:hypothetical protein